MEYRYFKNTQLKTSVIGLGGWPMGKGMYGAVDEVEVIAALHKAYDLGITLFDTAPNYGWGASEETMGRALKGKRQNCIIVTKAGIKWDPVNHEDKGLELDSSKEFLNKSIEGSLKRLQTDYIDLFLIHFPDTSRPFSEPMEVFAKWKKEGKIRYGGVSNFSAEQMKECLKTFPILCDQVGYNLFDRRPEKELFPFCKKNGISAMAFGSLSYGLLTGTMTKDTKFGDDDWRRGLNAFGQLIFEGKNYLHNLEIVEKLKKIAASQGKTVAQLAAAWVVSNPVVAVALTGVRKPSEIEENVVAANWKLTKDIKAEIEKAFAD
jgi:aryl-alcohol dehydrogenase-like predicted oxidoreductase